MALDPQIIEMINVPQSVAAAQAPPSVGRRSWGYTPARLLRDLIGLFAASIVSGLTVAAAVVLLAANAAAEPSTHVTHRVSHDETLMSIARRYGLGFTELRAANPEVDPWLPGEGREVVVPTLHLAPTEERAGIVVNLADQRLYFLGGRDVRARSYPLGIGRAGCETPTGTTHVASKRRDPVWVPPASIRAARPGLPAAIPPGPNNPLGAFALNLGWEGYVIHGTNRPEGIGRRVSHGCLRLYPEDIERLFSLVAIGTKVTIVDQEVKLGWIGEELYLEVHPSQEQADQIEVGGTFRPEPLPGLREAILAYAQGRHLRIDWDRVQRIAEERNGLAERISR